jgi:hypothetical protein
MPDPSIEPTILPKDPAIKDNNKVIIMDNSGATSSVARDSIGKNLMYLPPNSNYSMSGNERYVNTGVVIPKGPSPPGTPELNEFMITFENPGTYNTHVYSIHG